MDPQRSASNNADKRQEALQKPALWCALRPPPSLLPLVMTTAMHERVIGRRWGGCPSVGSPRNRPKQALPHALSLLLTHSCTTAQTHTQHTYTARNHVRRGQDLGRASNFLHQAGGGRAQQLRYVVRSCPACLPSFPTLPRRRRRRELSLTP